MAAAAAPAPDNKATAVKESEMLENVFHDINTLLTNLGMTSEVDFYQIDPMHLGFQEFDARLKHDNMCFDAFAEYYKNRNQATFNHETHLWEYINHYDVERSLKWLKSHDNESATCSYVFGLFAPIFRKKQENPHSIDSIFNHIQKIAKLSPHQASPFFKGFGLKTPTLTLAEIKTRINNAQRLIVAIMKNTTLKHLRYNMKFFAYVILMSGLIRNVTRPDYYEEMTSAQKQLLQVLNDTYYWNIWNDFYRLYENKFPSLMEMSRDVALFKLAPSPEEIPHVLKRHLGMTTVGEPKWYIQSKWPEWTPI